MDSHVHFRAVRITRTPAPGEPADIQAFRFGHNKLVRNFLDTSCSNRSKFANHKRKLLFYRGFKDARDAFLDRRIAGRLRVMAFRGPPHVNREKQIVFRVRLQKPGTHFEQVLLALSPLVGIDHQWHADTRSAHFRDDCIVGGEEIVCVHRLRARFVTDVHNQVLLMVRNDLQHLVAEPELHRFNKAVPVACRIMDFGNRNHPVRNALSNYVVEIADSATGIPNDSNAVGARLCYFRDGLSFSVGPYEHMVDAAENNLFIVFAVKKTILYKKTRFCRSHIHIIRISIFYKRKIQLFIEIGVFFLKNIKKKVETVSF